MAEEFADREDAQRELAAARSTLPGRYSAGGGAWAAAVFGTLLAVISVICAIPPVAHAVFRMAGNPVALVGAVFWGLIAWPGIRQVLRLRSAQRYLATAPSTAPDATEPPRPTGAWVAAILGLVGWLYFLILAIPSASNAIFGTDGAGGAALYATVVWGAVSWLGFRQVHKAHARRQRYLAAHPKRGS